MPAWTVGSLCTGCGGLDLGLEAAGYETRWQAEIEPACETVLSERFPGVPNHGDLRSVRWENVEPVTAVAAGFPCQPVSIAGKGLAQQDERWLWPEVVRALRVLRPRHVIVENVPGLALRGLGDVVAGLAELLYVGSAIRLRASDVGAPHRRERIFLLASLADPELGGVDADGGVRGGGARRGDPAGRALVSAGSEVARAADAQPDRSGAVADAERERLDGCGGRDAGRAARDGADRRAVAPRPPAAPTDASGARREGPRQAVSGGRIGAAGDGHAPADADCGGREVERQQEPRGVEGAHGGELDRRGAVRELADAAGERRRRWPRRARRDEQPGPEAERAESDAAARDGARVEWGAFEPAVRQWESLFRPAPRPTDARGRLSPDFVEWMLGYPAGWTDVTGVPRTKRLFMLGNSVQVQCGTIVGELLETRAVRDAALDY